MDHASMIHPGVQYGIGPRYKVRMTGCATRAGERQGRVGDLAKRSASEPHRVRPTTPATALTTSRRPELTSALATFGASATSGAAGLVAVLAVARLESWRLAGSPKRSRARMVRARGLSRSTVGGAREGGAA
jgi:hypothetical protein